MICFSSIGCVQDCFILCFLWVDYQELVFVVLRVFMNLVFIVMLLCVVWYLLACIVIKWILQRLFVDLFGFWIFNLKVFLLVLCICGIIGVQLQLGSCMVVIIIMFLKFWLRVIVCQVFEMFVINLVFMGIVVVLFMFGLQVFGMLLLLVLVLLLLFL